jgi:hypothetical protein
VFLEAEIDLALDVVEVKWLPGVRVFSDLDADGLVALDLDVDLNQNLQVGFVHVLVVWLDPIDELAELRHLAQRWE